MTSLAWLKCSFRLRVLASEAVSEDMTAESRTLHSRLHSASLCWNIKSCLMDIRAPRNLLCFTVQKMCIKVLYLNNPTLRGLFVSNSSNVLFCHWFSLLKDITMAERIKRAVCLGKKRCKFHRHYEYFYSSWHPTSQILF